MVNRFLVSSPAVRSVVEPAAGREEMALLACLPRPCRAGCAAPRRSADLALALLTLWPHFLLQCSMLPPKPPFGQPCACSRDSAYDHGWGHGCPRRAGSGCLRRGHTRCLRLCWLSVPVCPRVSLFCTVSSPLGGPCLNSKLYLGPLGRGHQLHHVHAGRRAQCRELDGMW